MQTPDNEYREYISVICNEIFKRELKEELIPLIISEIHKHNESKSHDIMERVDSKFDVLKTSYKNKFHRIAKILMEE